jgi:hypothetical protein
LEEQHILGSLRSGALEEHDVHPIAGELFKQQDLIGIFTTEPIGAVDEQHLDVPLGGQVPETLEARPDEGGPAPAFVLEDGAIRDQILVRGGVGA